MSAFQAETYFSDAFDDNNFANFMRLIDLIYESDESESRMPLMTCSRANLEKIDLEYEIVSSMFPVEDVTI